MDYNVTLVSNLADSPKSAFDLNNDMLDCRRSIRRIINVYCYFFQRRFENKKEDGAFQHKRKRNMMVFFKLFFRAIA